MKTIFNTKFFILLNLTLFFAPITTLNAGLCKEFPFIKPKAGELAIINCDFHKLYENRVSEIIKTFGAPGGVPIVLNLGGTLILKYNGTVKTIDITPPAYHNLKAFGHSAFSIYFILSQTKPGSIDKHASEELKKLQNSLKDASSHLNQLELPSNGRVSVKKLITTTDRFLDKLLKNKYWRREELTSFYRTIRPLISQTATLSGLIELDQLDKAINEWQAPMTENEKSKIGVVVATAHQARNSEISLQYFATKFGFRYGQGAQFENKFVVIEDKFDEPSALKMLARHYLDRDAAQIIFNDPDRLQKDVLGDTPVPNL
jgi:hypothetical protein